MKGALALSALSAALVACSSPPETPKATLPTVSEAPSFADRILVCASQEDSAAAAVDRCVTSDLDMEALASTIARWEQAQPLWSDILFNTASFSRRYPLRDGERDCLRRAFCQPMQFEER